MKPAIFVLVFSCFIYGSFEIPLDNDIIREAEDLNILSNLVKAIELKLEQLKSHGRLFNKEESEEHKVKEREGGDSISNENSVEEGEEETLISSPIVPRESSTAFELPEELTSTKTDLPSQEVTDDITDSVEEEKSLGTTEADLIDDTSAISTGSPTIRPSLPKLLSKFKVLKSREIEDDVQNDVIQNSLDIQENRFDGTNANKMKADDVLINELHALAQDAKILKQEAENVVNEVEDIDKGFENQP